MKRLLILIFAILAIATQSYAQKVYIATKKGAVAYHKVKTCSYFRKDAKIKEVSLDNAKKMGRSACYICYSSGAAMANRNANVKPSAKSFKDREKYAEEMKKAAENRKKEALKLVKESKKNAKEAREKMKNKD